MAFYDGWFGKGRLGARARAAEARGELTKAAELFREAGDDAEVARVLVLRGDGEVDVRTRLPLYTQAARLAPEESDVSREARKKRARLLLALAGDAAVSAVARHEVLEAARDLEAVGEPLEAADAYARAGDKEGEARALQAAGDVERLEQLLATEQHDARLARTRDERAKDVEAMIESGRRREALDALDALIAASPDDLALRERASGLRARRVLAPVVAVEAGAPGAPLARQVLVTGDAVVIGRTEGAVKVPSNAVSREHLRIAREGGEIVVRDLGSRNGTQLRGINLAGALPVGDGLELTLGKEVPVRIAPSAHVPGAIEIEVAGDTYVASLGPTRTSAPGLELRPGLDGWIELALDGVRAYRGELELVTPATLLVGDAIAIARGGPPVLRIVGT